MSYSTIYISQSSSSSASTSGITTPTDNAFSSTIPFPGLANVQGKDSLNLNSTLSSDRHHRNLSLSSATLSSVTHPPKLSLDITKAKAISAITNSPESHSPLGAFSLTSSAESQLRSIVLRSRAESSLAQFASPKTCRTSSVPGRARTLSMRSLPIPWVSDISDEKDSYWPYRKTKSNTPVIPSLSRSPSPPESACNEGPSLDSRIRTVSLQCGDSPRVTSGKMRSHLLHTRSASGSGVDTDKCTTSPNSKRAFLSPPRRTKPKHSERILQSTPNPNLSILPRTQETPGPLPPLDPRLAAVENSSRLRSRCVCSVCGKAGVDYPRCPRCNTAW